MAQRAALLALLFLACTSAPAAAQDEAANELPHVNFHFPLPLVYPSPQNYLEVQSRDLDGWIQRMRLTINGVVEQEGPPTTRLPLRFKRPGSHTITVEVFDNEGARGARTISVGVSRVPSKAGPRFSLFVPPHLPIAEAVSQGVPVSVMCKHTCAAVVELQLTRYRARKLGLKPPRKGKLTVAADAGLFPNWEHHFLLRPKARVRRALRRARNVPVLLKVTSFNTSFGYPDPSRTRSTQAEIELTGSRRKRRR